jgi:two-component system CheB/CheR fusion protein
VAQLQQELTALREYLQSVIEGQESTNEELKSANEEILSSNEELQSTNEELQTAKEEAQSANEELATVNEELRHRNAELARVNNDLVNLLSGVNIPIVMVGRDLRIRRFTPLAEKVFNLIPTDLGRPILDIKPNLKLDNLDRVLTDVIDRLAPHESEVQGREGHWYSMRIRPYVTLDNKIDGASIVLLDIDSIKKALEKIQEKSGHGDGEAAKSERKADGPDGAEHPKEEGGAVAGP